jgi:dUTP pyrophosphatase
VDEFIISPGKLKLIPTGLIFEIPIGFEGQIRPRSGLSLHHGITVLNAPGTIDSDYRGEVGVILANFGEHDFSIVHGERIAQIVFQLVPDVCLIEADELSTSLRDKKGFGSSGVK